MVTQQELHSMFAYVYETGKLIHLRTVQGGKQAGQEAGSPHNMGYLQIMINRRKYLIHRLIWMYVYGEWPSQIDHINGNRSDNRIENLRTCTYSQNHGNRRIGKNNTSGAKGIFLNKKDNLWSVYVACQYKGCYKNKEDAIKAYDKFAKEHFGEFALTNETLRMK